MASKVGSGVVGVGFGNKNYVSLEDYVQSNSVIPVSLFSEGKTVAGAITSAIDYLRNRGEGTVEVPSSEGMPTLRVRVSLDTSANNSSVIVNFITSSYTYPILEQTRPYLDTAWEVGDIIFNTDIISNPCMGWVCVERGIPGAWKQFANIKSWHTQIEALDYLPDPTKFQEGRQVILTKSSTAFPVGIYVCIFDGSVYRWIQQNMTVGTEEQRPSRAEDNWWFFNTTTGYPQWYSKTDDSWHTIFDEAKYLALWGGKLNDVDTHIQEQVEETMHTQFEELSGRVDSKIEEFTEGMSGLEKSFSDSFVAKVDSLEQIYQDKYDSWYSDMYNCYLQMVEKPVDTYLARHPLYSNAKNVLSFIRVAVLSSGLYNAEDTSRLYTAVDFVESNITSEDALPDSYIVLLKLPTGALSKNYIQIFDSVYYVVSPVGDDISDAVEDMTLAVLVTKGSDTATVISQYSFNVHAVELKGEVESNILGDSENGITYTNSNFRMSEKSLKFFGLELKHNADGSFDIELND